MLKIAIFVSLNNLAIQNMKALTGIASFVLAAMMIGACGEKNPSQKTAESESFVFHDGCPQVVVAQGTLEGTLESGLKIFRGIPFGAPPVGDLRWKAPWNQA